MPVDVQTCLMVELKRVDQSLENYIEIKDILSTVEKLEEENDELKDRLKSINESSRHLQESAAETRQ
jgi:cell shape-determining protein MreC